MRCRGLVLAVVLMCTALATTEIPAEEEEREEEPAESALELIAELERSVPPPRRVWDEEFTKEVMLLSASTVYDVETTFAGLRQCRDCRERNPVIRELLSGGRTSVYAFEFGLNAAFLYFAHRDRISDDPRERKGWRRALRILSIAHLSVGTLNLRLVF